MSHDRKPGRVKVVQAADGPPQRRRGEGSKAGTAASSAQPMGRKGQVMLIVLFLLASIGSAIAVELQLPS